MSKYIINCSYIFHIEPCSVVSKGVVELPGAFTPSCTPDGLYEAKQCHGSTGHCWCVETKYGNEILGTRKRPGSGEVNCGKELHLALPRPKYNYYPPHFSTYPVTNRPSN